MKKLFIGLSLISLIGLGGCANKVLNINQNPNQATYSTPQLSTAVALDNAARANQTNYMNFSMWMGYTATNTGWALDQTTNSYNITTSYMNGIWNSLYLNLETWNYIAQNSKGLPLYSAIAKIFQAYDFSSLVDVYNNVPFSDALLKNGNLSPKYDKGSDIYDSCVALLDTAISLLKSPATLTTIAPDADSKSITMYSGDIANSDLTTWVKFANSLKLRLLLNQSNVSGKQAYIQHEVAMIDQSELMGIGDDAVEQPGYLNSTGKFSPYYGFYYSAVGTATDQYKYFAANSFALNFYTSTNDPRESYFYDKLSSGVFSGNNFGNQNAVAASAVGAPSMSPTAPGIIMTAAEALFDQAEAIQRGWFTGDAGAIYNDAIVSSFEFTGVADADNAAAAYTSQNDPNTNWSLASNKLKFLIYQKWASLNNMSLLTTYNDYRRTGYPTVPVSIFPGHLPHVPYRLLYPQSEYGYNATNVTAQGSIDGQTSKVFWNN